jgi:hypothetical protein
VHLLLVTGDARLAGRAYDAGIDRVFVDLEQRGKAQRQAGRGLFLSTHSMEDVEAIRSAVPEIVLMVRINPFHDGTESEIRRVVGCGADVVMLPMVELPEQVADAAEIIAGSARLSVLIETTHGLAALARTVRVRGLDEVHIGLNDLAMSMAKATLFDPLCDGTVDAAAAVVGAAELPFGFGGVTAPGVQGLPVDPNLVIAEHVRLHSHTALLGRSFRSHFENDTADGPISEAVAAIRHAERHWSACSSSELGRLTRRSSDRSVGGVSGRSRQRPTGRRVRGR